MVEQKPPMLSTSGALRRLIPLVLVPLVACVEKTPSPNQEPEPDARIPEVDTGPAQVRSEQTRDRNPSITDAELVGLVAANSAFAADVYGEATREPDLVGKNIVFAPHSVSTALAMTLAGALGPTAAEMAATLHVGPLSHRVHAAQNRLDLILASRAEAGTSDRKPFRLHTVNALFGQKGQAFVANFLDTLAVHYGAGVRVLDFAKDPDAARVVINDWVEDVTEDKILELLPAGSIDATTRLVLVNAIYFSAAWMHPFDEANTAPRPFTTAAGTVDVKTLRQVAQLGYGTGPGFRAAFLPFDGDQLEMGIVVPDGQTLAQLEAGLDGARVAQIQASRTGATLTLQMPAFSFRTPISLAKALKSLGMPSAFGADADFTGLMPGGGKIADVIHQAFIGVDEDGAEAAGATAVIIGPPSAPVPGPPAELIVDQPFLFFIADRPTGEVLFLGRVVDPRS